MKSVAALLCFYLLTGLVALGQTGTAPAAPLVMGEIVQVTSAALGEVRTLNVYLPEGYAQDSASYPVLYLLDGSAHEDLLHVCGLVQFLTMIEAMPPTMVVGIANVDRKRDFTFPTTIDKDKKDYPTTGGSASFIQFLEEELQPFVNAQYRSNGHETIIGQSLGGLVATEILLKKPALFDRYLIVSPSLWWDNESLLHAAPDHLAEHAKVAAHIVVAVGNEGKVMEKDAADLVDILREKGHSKLKVEFVSLPEENHATILHRAAYRGLELLNKVK